MRFSADSGLCSFILWLLIGTVRGRPLSVQDGQLSVGPRHPRSKFTVNGNRPNAYLNDQQMIQQIIQQMGADSKSVAGGLNSLSPIYQSVRRFSPTDTGAPSSGSSQKYLSTTSDRTIRKRLNFNMESSQSEYRGTDVALKHQTGLVPSNIRWEHLIHIPHRSGKYQHHYFYQGTSNALSLVRFNYQQVLLQPRSAKRANFKISALTDQDEDTPCGTAAYVPQQPLENDGAKGYAKACLLMPALAKAAKRQFSSADGSGSLYDLAYHSHSFGKRLQSPAAMYSEGFDTPGEMNTQGTRGSPQGKYTPFQTIQPTGDVILDLATATVTPSTLPQYTQTTVPLPHSFYQVSPSGTTGPPNVTAPLTEDEKGTSASLSTVTLQQREGNYTVTVSLESEQLTDEPVTITDPPQDGHAESLLNADHNAMATSSPHWNVTGAVASASPMLML